MKLSMNWLKKYIELPKDLTLEQLAHDLTMRTVEVEGYEDLGDKYKNIVVGIIKSVKAHPNADKLRVCMVDVGDEDLQIVCGGSNLYEGEKVVVSKIGSYVVWHGEGEPVEIKMTKMRGVKSYGMICGADEVGLEDLYPLKDETEIVDLGDLECLAGDNIADVLELRDAILEIDNKSLTNRPDLYCHYGIARELSAIYKVELKSMPEYKKENISPYSVEIKDHACRRYVGVKIENIEIKESPDWLKTALSNVGMRPINNVVDITNYVMLSTGNPTHAFDFDKIKEGIVVRFAEKGERLTLLDGEELELDTSSLVISDHEKVLGLAGIMGGLNDSISDETHSIVLEVANFEGRVIRNTLKKYDLRTESSIRFEKNIDTARVDMALGLSVKLFKEILPEAKITLFLDNYPANTGRSEVEVGLDFLNTRLGREISKEEVIALLQPLGFEIEYDDGVFKVISPPWRSTGDISIRDDILEEVARMIGYDNFDIVVPLLKLNPLINQRRFQTEREIKEYLAHNRGFYEVVNYPWVEDEFINASNMDDAFFVELSSPPSPTSKRLRNSLIPCMLWAVVVNEKNYEEFKIFEMGKVFKEGFTSPSVEEERLPIEEKMLSMAIYGKDAEKLFFEMKGAIEGLNDLRIEKISFSQKEKPLWADKDLWLNIETNGDIIGAFGAFTVKGHRDIGIKNGVIILSEINFNKITPTPSRENSFTPLEIFPEVENDIAILADEIVSWKDIRETVEPLVKEVKFIEEYRGSQVEEGKKSIVFKIRLGSNDGTLTQEDIQKKRNQILKKLSGRFGAELRQ